jgi:hypothetical protein
MQKITRSIGKLIQRCGIAAFLITVVNLSPIAVSAGESKLTTQMSPKLKEFLSFHPKELSLLTNFVVGSFSNKTVRIMYYYSEDGADARAYHYYPDAKTVSIVLKENQEVCDEFICILFELINSQSQSLFVSLSREVAAGSIDKNEFAREVLKREHQAMLRAKNLLRQVNPSKEIASCYSYQRLAECADKFEEFYENIRSKTPEIIKNYEEMYDVMRGKAD